MQESNIDSEALKANRWQNQQNLGARYQALRYDDLFREMVYQKSISSI